MTQDNSQVCIKIAVGHSTSLVPGESETPYKLVYDKGSQEVSIVSFSNHSFGYFYEQGQLVKRPIDYGQVPFTHDHDSLKRLGKELGRIACEIEKGFKG